MSNFQDYTMMRLGRVEKMATYLSLSEPVLLFNRFRIYEISYALAGIVIFGVIRQDWFLASLLVLVMLLGSPALRRRKPPTFLYRQCLDRFSKLPCGPFSWGNTRSPF
ncbi:MAG: hypothetical protein HYW48_02455 [Deltaproteobacteria bacterium]|nr:hypothetical protein [Deltaproteobacteria bacterium]